MPSEGFKNAIPATKKLQTYALDFAAIGIGFYEIAWHNIPQDSNLHTNIHFCLIKLLPTYTYS
jgi:hypothetical protein